MPVGNDEYLRRSQRNLKAGLAGLTQRFAIVRALQRQQKAINEQAAKYQVDLTELGITLTAIASPEYKLVMKRQDLPELATTAKLGGEGVKEGKVGLNLNQSAPDSKNSQYPSSPEEGKAEKAPVGWEGAYMGPNPEENDIRVLREASELKAALEWPVEASVRIVGGCPNPRLLRGSLEDGRGCVVWSKGLERVRAGCVVGCVKVKDGEYRRKSL